MADQLYLSYTLPENSAPRVVRAFEKLIARFPYSRLSVSATTFRAHAVSTHEPPLVEKSLEDPPDVAALLELTREYACADCGLFVETSWDLWQYIEPDWKVTPTRVILAAFPPQFESGEEEQIRIEFGIDTLFLPLSGVPQALLMARSNIRSLLHLVHQLDEELGASADRRLWTDTGDNFAGRLESALREADSAAQ